MAARRTGAVIALVVIPTAVLAGLVASAWYTCGFRGCPDVDWLRSYVPEQASVVLDRRGSEIGRLFRVNRRVVPLDSLPAYVPAAFVAIEDKRFYQHHGVDWERVPGAVLADVRHRGFVQGFSTITMQLARTLFPDRLPVAEKSLVRKLSEMRVAAEIEQRYSKRAILQMYLNQIYFGHGAWGIDAAAEEYFGKPASALTLPEAAMLAGLPRSPSRDNPRTNRVAALQRRHLVLTLLAEQGLITAEQARVAESAPVRVRRGVSRILAQRASYFLEQVRSLLEDQLGDAIYTQGLTIHTTLDLPTQEVAEAELERQLEAIEHGAYGPFRHPRYDPRVSTTAHSAEAEPDYLQGALVMLDSQTGDVLAYVGGRNFAQSSYDRVAQARRQPGSAFKPFVYTAAVEAGYPPTYRLLDAPLVVPLARGRTWQPRNYDGVFEGSLTMVRALVQSRNVPTVRLASQLGLERVAATAEAMGIRAPIPLVPSMPLGVLEVTPLQLTAAYTAFSTLGNRVQPRLVTSVEDRAGNEIWASEARAQRTLDPAVAFVMTSMLEQAVDQGTGRAVRAAGYAGPAAGKTGTTQNGTDAWFVGFTPRLTMGVWIGFDRPAPITPGATGGPLAGTVWGRIMARTAAPSADWLAPPGVDRVWVGADGVVVAGDCPPPLGATPMWLLAGTEPPQSGCAPAGGYGQIAPGESSAVDTMVGAPRDEGWWNRLRARIFGGTDSAGTGVGARRQPIGPPAEGRAPPGGGWPGPPLAEPPPKPSPEPPSRQPPLEPPSRRPPLQSQPGGNTLPAPPPGRILGRPIPTVPPQGSPPDTGRWSGPGG